MTFLKKIFGSATNEETKIAIAQITPAIETVKLEISAEQKALEIEKEKMKLRKEIESREKAEFIAVHSKYFLGNVIVMILDIPNTKCNSKPLFGSTGLR